MRKDKFLCNILLSWFVVVSLVFQFSASVLASPAEPEPGGFIVQPTHYVLNFGNSSPLNSSIPAPADRSPFSPDQPAGWVTITSQDFEGTFRGNGWLVRDNNGATGGDNYWGGTGVRAHSGSKSAWAASGGADGQEPNGTSYPANHFSGTGYRPFSLVGATNAQVTLYVWLRNEFGQNPDTFFYWASSNGGYYSGLKMAGSTNDWQASTFDLSNVDGNGTSVIGESEVMVAFTFSSDENNNNYEGAYIDDIIIEKEEATPTCYTLTTSASPSGSGTVSASPAPDCAGGKYTAGTQVQLTANPSSGYSFVNWTGAVTGSMNPVEITMNGDKSVTANFTANPVCYTLTTNVSPSGSGSVSANLVPNCNGGTQYTSDTQVELTANSSTGYGFANWSGGTTGAHNPTTVIMNGNKSVTANFTTNPQCYTLTTNAAPADAGSISASPAPNCNNGTQYTSGTSVQLTANPSSDYRFTIWFGSVWETENPFTITMNGNKSVTAIFDPKCNFLNTSVNPSGGGSVSASVEPNCSGGKYEYDTQVQLTANPSSGYTFANWSGSVISSTNPITVTMNGYKSVTANFNQVCYTLTTSVSPADNGSVSANPPPNCSGGKYEYGTQVQLTASPAAGNRFDHWSGDASGSANPITVTMSANKSVAANFTLKNPIKIFLPIFNY